MLKAGYIGFGALSTRILKLFYSSLFYSIYFSLSKDNMYMPE